MSPTKKKNPFLLSQEEITKRTSSSKSITYPASFEACITEPASMKPWHPLMKDDRNVVRTTSLFFESKREADPAPNLRPIFTLKDFDYSTDGTTYIALKPIYFSYNHIPGFEYDFAMDVFGSWDVWQKITRSSIRTTFQEWRDELEVKIKSNAIKAMLDASKEPGGSGVAAAKYLADKGYLEGSKSKRGRPSKEEVERERKIQAEVKDTLAADMERIGISVAK